MRQLLLFCFLIANFLSTGQDVRLSNPSFEAKVQFGDYTLLGWDDIGTRRFPSTSPPFVHSSNTNFFSVENIEPTHGKTFLCLVVREDCSFHGISQDLVLPLKKSQAYKFNIQLARAAGMESATKHSGISVIPFNIPAVLRFIGLSDQDSLELLAVSEPIENEEWQAYEFHIQPKNDIEVLMIEAFYDSDSTSAYNGNILLDLISVIREVPEVPQHLTAPNDSILYPPLKPSIWQPVIVDRSGEEAQAELEFLANFYNRTYDAGIYWCLKKKGDNYIEKLIALHSKHKMQTVHIEHIQKAISSKPNLRTRRAYNQSNQWQDELESFLAKNRVRILHNLARYQKPRGFDFKM